MAQIQVYIQIATLLFDSGIAIAGKFKAFLDLFSPGHALTDDQINAIEQMGMLDSQRRALERRAMGTPSA